MLSAAERGTLGPDRATFNAATLPPPVEEPSPAPELRIEGPDESPSTPRRLEARLKTPEPPGIPRAPLVPRFTPRGNTLPSYAPPSESAATSAAFDFDLVALNDPEPSPQSAERPGLAATPKTGLYPSARSTDLDLGDREQASAEPPPPRASTPASGAGAPTGPFAIATWIAERDFERALAAIEQAGAESSPELSLLEARALLGLGRKAAARRSLDRLCRAPLIDPDLRGAAARLLLSLGDVDRAEVQARRAHNEDPGSETSRLTLAWAVARNSTWRLSPRGAAEVSQLLESVSAETSAEPVLAYALTALASTSPDVARQAADKALSLDDRSPDALAVAAVVAKRQARFDDAERLRKRLLEVDAEAADELAATLAQLEVTSDERRTAPLGPVSSAKAPSGLDGAAPRSAPGASPASIPRSATSRPTPRGQSPWDEKEQRLAQGDSRSPLFDFEQGLARRLEAVPARTSADELGLAALVTARYLTEAPIARHFAPFDLSLFSIARLDATLSLIYRGSVGPRTELRGRVLLGLGAYAGECLRRAYAGEWLGASTDFRSLHIEGQGLCFAPFRDVDARLQRAQPLQVADSPLPHPGAEPLGQRVALDAAPPVPWAPAAWPEGSALPELGAHLADSPVGLYCASIELPLDLSFASLRSLDRYVTLLAPPLAPPDPEAAWVRRAAVLVGAYLGEVLRATRGGEWELTRGELRPEAYRIALPGGAKALPVAAAFERLSGRRLEQPSDYARRITG